jgi:fermentation-respiration switch protein FrsA (DUF1100 family)
MNAAPPGHKRQSPWWWRVTRILLVGYLLLALMFLWLENSLTYFPMKYPAGRWEAADLAIEDAYFSAPDGTKLHGWYLAGANPQAVILFCHGNGGNVTHRDELLRQLPQYVDVSILVFDYRGYGRSEGTPSESGVLADARAARAWLAARAGTREQDIVLWGESIGGAIAVDLAARDGARALILEDTFTSLPEVAAYHYPWLPVRWLMHGKLNSLEAIRHYRGPLLMAHGDADTIVPYSFGERLFAAANEPKRFITQPSADHNDPRESEFFEEVRRFLLSLPTQKAGA